VAEGAIKTSRWDLGIWGLAFGYFAAYAPYSALTKAVTTGLLPYHRGKIDGITLVPMTIVASFVAMLVFLTAKGWWKYAGTRRVLGRDIPFPSVWTALSGLCSAAIIVTTTLAYTFEGVSIVFIMLLMRGGVLVIAPLVDLVARRRVRWFSWLGLLLSLVAVVVADRGGDARITFACGINVLAYLAGYFIKLQVMSRKAKSTDPNANVRYFVEEQLVSTPALLIVLGAAALIDRGQIMHLVRAGFTSFPKAGLLPEAFTIGVLSQGTGIFGGLILLDKRENTFCVPVNRSSSILAGVVASFSLAYFFHARMPGKFELLGAAMVIGAILFLTIPPLIEKARAKQLANKIPRPPRVPEDLVRAVAEEERG
jgi:general stress protein CsbA